MIKLNNFLSGPKELEGIETSIKLEKNILTYSNAISSSISIELESYNTYYVIMKKNPSEKLSGFEKLVFKNKVIRFLSRKELETTYSFHNLMRLKSEIEFVMPIQIDTGIISPDHDKIDCVISLYGNLDNVFIETPYNIENSNVDTITDDTQQDFLKTPRYELMKSYSLTIDNGNEYKSTFEGVSIDENSHTISLSNKDFFDIKIKKYEKDFSNILNNDYDNEKIYIETNSGIINTSIVYLKNGEGYLRLYPFGYTGDISLKLTYESYNTVGLYNFTII